MAATKALQQWCKQQCDGYRDVSITNMTTSFRDGLAFCAILHKHRPDLIDFNSLSKENIYENNHLAFRVAEEELGIPALLDAEDMVQLRVPDRLSMLTYVSQYYNFFHGRSPIGGMGGIKRPPPDTTEEPAGKKFSSHAPTSPQPAHSRPIPAPRRSPSALKRNSVIENAPVRATRREMDSGTSVSSSCTVCRKHVHLVQRHLADGKLYHRNCFRCKQCTGTLQPGNYKSGDEPGTFICTNHQQVLTPAPATANITPTAAVRGSNQPAGGQFGGVRSSPTITSTAALEPSSKAGTNRLGSAGANSALSEQTNRTAVGYYNNNNNKTNSPGAANTAEQGNRTAPNFPNATNKGSPSPAVQEHLYRSAVGFFNGNKDSPSASAAGTEPANKTANHYLNTSRGSSSAANVTTHEQPKKTAVGYFNAGKGSSGIASTSLPQPNTTQKEAKKDLPQTSQQTTSSVTSNPATAASSHPVIVVSSSPGRWTSSVTKEDPKESSTSPTSSASSTAKNKDARDKFFQSSSVPAEPANGKSAAGQESPLNSHSNGPGRSAAIPTVPANSEPSSEKDKARSFLLKALPGSTSPTSLGGVDNASAVYIPHRNLDQHQNGSKFSSPKAESNKLNPTEKKEIAVPKSVSSPKPPTSSPMYSVSKAASGPSTGKGPVPTLPNIPSPGTGQKGNAPSPKAENPSSSVSKSEAPEEWRSRLKPVEKRASPQGVLHTKDKSPLIDQGRAAQKPPTVITTVTITPSPAGKENKPAQPSTSTTPQSRGTNGSSTETPPRKKLLPVNLDLIKDWPKPEQKWQDGIMATENEEPRWHPHMKREETIPGAKKTGNGQINMENAYPKPSETRSPYVPASTHMAAPIKLRPEYIPEEVIQEQLLGIERELDQLELRGVDMEKQLRSCDGDDAEDALMVDWFKLIHEKQLLLRLESELMYTSKQQALEDQQVDVESELRNLMSLPEKQKSSKQKERESELLEKYLDIVNNRSEIIECLDEDRIREKEEDEMMHAMIQKKQDSQKEVSPEPSIKRKSRFTFSNLWKPKDKNTA
ncbi:hypothetical protein FKM82_002989 [Ascaphus truei]